MIFLILNLFNNNKFIAMILDNNVFEFLKNLSVNNNKDWFNDNRDVYKIAKLDFEKFVQNLILETYDIDKSIGAINAKDCIFRIFRDVRFSKDKTPYKINFGAHIGNGGRKSIYAGYYLHLEPDNSFVGGGLYMPQSDILKKVRTLIIENPQEFKSILDDSKFNKTFGKIYGETLKTAPRGFDKNDDNIELIRYKSYAFVKSISDKELLDKNFDKKILDIFRTLKPMNDFLNSAIRD